MLKLLDLLNIIPFSKRKFLNLFFGNNKLFLTILESNSKFLLILFHLLDKNFFISQPLL